MLSINDILSHTAVCGETGELAHSANQIPSRVSLDDWKAGLDKAVVDGFLLRVPSITRGDRFFLAEPFAEIDGDVFRISSIGAENNEGVFVNACSTVQFRHHANGLNPQQACQRVPSASIRRATEFPSAADPLEATRMAYEAVPNRRLVTYHPVSTVHKGVVGHFMIAQMQAANNKCIRPVLHISRLVSAKPLAGMPLSLMEKNFRLTGSNELVPVGLPGVAREFFVEKWREAGLPVPFTETQPAKETC